MCNIIGLILWMALVYDTPDENPRITWQEMVLIVRNRRDSTVEKVRFNLILRPRGKLKMNDLCIFEIFRNASLEQ